MGVAHEFLSIDLADRCSIRGGGSNRHQPEESGKTEDRESANETEPFHIALQWTALIAVNLQSESHFLFGCAVTSNTNATIRAKLLAARWKMLIRVNRGAPR